MDRAWQRIAWALGASMLLHIWFIQTTQQPGAPRVTVAASAPLTATLSRSQLEASTPEAAPRDAHNLKADTKYAQSKRDVAAARVWPVVERLVQPATTADGTAAAASTLQSSDPTYYTARDLDVFPKALTALDLGLRVQAAGTVRATLLIDEAGTVNEVRAVNTIDAKVAEIESAARDLLLRTRFTPARKDGRLVKAELLVSLDYGQPQR